MPGESSFRSFFRPTSPRERLGRFGLQPSTITVALSAALDPRADAELTGLEQGLTRAETLVSLLEGRFERHLGLLALTSARLVFRRHRHPGPFVLDIPLDEVTDLSVRQERMTQSLLVQAQGRTHTVDKILGEQGQRLVLAVENSRHPAAPAVDPLVALGELRALHDAGVIDDHEFALRKAALVEQI
ncbi:hypothetical protein JL107_12745 [Nakamurella flavida]|uniref:SHOCT domain-containing protein n=1 Tax=Nakamurella flavida TaxID=363630 RepID=A0A939C5V1_9ACTN|nr:hypothetical protein [Nakamurella flavida]MBM9477314.1 hypothetical protein [Nakamurella flavida]MDP9779770.1 hypothetical protein [Nakamurella flavida]